MWLANPKYPIDYDTAGEVYSRYRDLTTTKVTVLDEETEGSLDFTIDTGEETETLSKKEEEELEAELKKLGYI